MAPLAASLLALVLFGASGFFAWQQLQTLRGLPLLDNVSPEDRRYYRRQSWRRLFGCTLLAAIGLMITGSYVGGLEEHIDAIGVANADHPDGEAKPPNPEQKRLETLYIYCWIGILLLLMVLMFVAAWDVWEIHRYGARHYRRIQDDRRAMLERQLVQLRRERGLRHPKSSDN